MKIVNHRIPGFGCSTEYRCILREAVACHVIPTVQITSNPDNMFRNRLTETRLYQDCILCHCRRDTIQDIFEGVVEEIE